MKRIVTMVFLMVIVAFAGFGQFTAGEQIPLIQVANPETPEVVLIFDPRWDVYQEKAHMELTRTIELAPGYNENAKDQTEVKHNKRSNDNWKTMIIDNRVQLDHPLIE